MKKIFQAKTLLKQQIGRAEKTVDEDYDKGLIQYEKQIEQLRAIRRALEKHIQITMQYGQSFKELSSALHAFYGDDDFMKRGSKSVMAGEMVSDLTGVAAGSLDDSRAQLHEWIEGLKSVKKRFDLREETRLNYDMAKDTFFTLQEHLPQTPAEIQKLKDAHDKYDEAKIAYHTIHDEVAAELILINNNRFMDFESVHKVIVSVHSEFFGDAHAVLKPLVLVSGESTETRPKLPPPERKAGASNILTFQPSNMNYDGKTLTAPAPVAAKLLPAPKHAGSAPTLPTGLVPVQTKPNGSGPIPRPIQKAYPPAPTIVQPNNNATAPVPINQPLYPPQETTMPMTRERAMTGPLPALPPKPHNNNIEAAQRSISPSYVQARGPLPSAPDRPIPSVPDKRLPGAPSKAIPTQQQLHPNPDQFSLQSLSISPPGPRGYYNANHPPYQ